MSTPRPRAGGEKLRWQQVTLPGPFMTYKVWEQEASDTKFVWARRIFEITPAQAKGLAVLALESHRLRRGGVHQRSEGRRERTDRAVSGDRPAGRPAGPAKTRSC